MRYELSSPFRPGRLPRSIPFVPCCASFCMQTPRQHVIDTETFSNFWIQEAGTKGDAGPAVTRHYNWGCPSGNVADSES